MRRWFLVAFCLLLLVGCSAENILPPTPTPAGAPPDVPVDSPVGTPVPSDDPQNVPAVTVTPALSNPLVNAWHYRRPVGLVQSALVPDGDGVALDANWAIDHAEYAYNWWGLSPSPDREQQIVIRNGDSFARGNIDISQEAIDTFIKAVSHFTPAQHLLSGNAWTDDYPSHIIEVTGTDGQKLLFISTSTGNPGDGPWNLIYNEQLYAQYDGTFGEALDGVFDFHGRGTVEDFIGGSANSTPIPVTVNFGTEGQPPQLAEGFQGLLPLADNFVYGLNLSTSTIEGSFIGRSSIGGYGRMIIGTFTDTTGISLTIENNTTVACTFVPVEGYQTYDVVGAAWNFTCPVEGLAEGQAFRYPISIALTTDTGEAATVSGTLTGVWSDHANPVLLPLPPMVREALGNDPDFIELLSRHEHTVASYNATLEPDLPNAIIEMTGQMDFFGSTEVNGQTVPYQLATLFSIKQGERPQWGLPASDLDSLIADTTALTTTQTLLTAFPNLKLTFGSTIPVDRTRGYALDGYYPQFGPTPRNACAVEPTPAEFTADNPYQEAGYRFADGDNYVTGTVIDGQWFPHTARLTFGEGIPAVMVNIGGELVPLSDGYFALYRTKEYSFARFGIDPSALTPEILEHFETVADGLGAEPNEGTDVETHPEWYVYGEFTLGVTADGNLELVSCQ